MKAKRKKLREITIDHEACKGCLLCVGQCSQEVLAVSKTRNAKGYLLPEAANLSSCSACCLCEMICPDLAIYVEVES